MPITIRYDIPSQCTDIWRGTLVESEDSSKSLSVNRVRVSKPQSASHLARLPTGTVPEGIELTWAACVANCYSIGNMGTRTCLNRGANVCVVSFSIANSSIWLIIMLIDILKAYTVHWHFCISSDTAPLIRRRDRNCINMCLFCIPKRAPGE